MPACLKRLLTFIVAMFLTIITGYAQKHEIGTFYSFGGIGLAYDYKMNAECFISTDIKAELSEVFKHNTDTPGISASLTANFIIKDWASANGNDLAFYAGPGMIIGYAKDFHSDYGYFFGLKGKIGIKCIFTDRDISISADLCPAIGTHAVITDNSVKMNIYNNGLLSIIVPAISIKYLF